MYLKGYAKHKNGVQTKLDQTIWGSINVDDVCQLSLSERQCSTQCWRNAGHTEMQSNPLDIFLKTPRCDLILPHFTILRCPIMLPSMKKKKGVGGHSSYHLDEPNNNIHSLPEEIVIASRQNQSPPPPQRTSAVFTRHNTAMNRVEVGTNQKSSTMCLINFFADKHCKQLQILWRRMNRKENFHSTELDEHHC